MIFPEIKRLYKYMSYNTNTISCLVNGEFWCAKPHTFNDPLDCGLQLLNEITVEAFVKLLEQYAKVARERKDSEKEKAFQKAIKQAQSGEIPATELLNKLAELERDAFAKKIQRIGILSLSEVNDNILMWSHYAEQHRGLCVELPRVSQNMLAKNEHTLPVRYSVKKPIISVNEQLLGDESLKKEIKRSLIYTKSADWAYEREWRFVAEEGNKTTKLDAKVASIIFGFKMPIEHRRTIANLLKGAGKIKFKEAILKKDEFGIDIVDVDISKYLTDPATQVATPAAAPPPPKKTTITKKTTTTTRTKPTVSGPTRKTARVTKPIAVKKSAKKVASKKSIA